ncbi:lipopolysaccharide biosynthesis protein [Tessaracoccus sp. MC1627]|uniref:lipopolysaccharide biosynthesis protein n=1 Tax=Tessaracoccus sp. MC1627 TaxID=2760312 RepID=UPI0015FF8CEC|nr:lipopolysaccharide biosynthesis protein [Tessaracoccus sp. MC1627]MBB1511519.1 lipopolysaccharide biosynthesis protein [Tessaracoccus sp. MC1627]
MIFEPVRLNEPAATGAAKRGLLSIIAIGLQGGTRFLSNLLIGRVAGPLINGAVASATALAFLLHTFWPSSSPGAASKFIARARGKKDDAEVHSVTRHIALRVVQVTGVLAVACPPLWVWVYDGQWWEGLCISVILITVSTSQFARGVHFGAGQVARGTRYDILISIIGIVTTVLLLSLGVRNLLLTLPMSLALGAYSLLCWPWTAHGTPERALRSEIDKFITFSALGSMASAGMLQASQLVAAWLGPEEAARFAPALLMVTPLSIIATALTMALYPSMAEAQGGNDTERLRRQTDLATRGFMAVMVPSFGGMAIAARPIIELVWGHRFDQSPALMPFFCLALLINNVATPSVSSITSGPHRNMWYTLLLSQAGLASAIVAWLLLVQPLGVFGVALGYGIGASVTAISLIVVAWRMYAQRWWPLFAQLVVAVAAIAGLSWWRHSSPPDHVLDLVVGTGFGLLWLGISVPTLRRLWGHRA